MAIYNFASPKGQHDISQNHLHDLWNLLAFPVSVITYQSHYHINLTINQTLPDLRPVRFFMLGFHSVEKHEEIFTWKLKLHYWPFVSGVIDGFVHRKLIIQSIDDFFVVILDMFLNKLLICQWYEIHWLSCYVTFNEKKASSVISQIHQE